MRVLSSKTSCQRLAAPRLLLLTHGAADSAAPTPEDSATAARKRALFDLMRRTKSVVIAGLDASLGALSIFENGPKAPTIADLWQQISAKRDVAAIKRESADPNFQKLLAPAEKPSCHDWRGNFDVSLLTGQVGLNEAAATQPNFPT